MQDKKPEPDGNMLASDRKSAQRNRTAGLAIALLLFALILYIATYARVGA